MEHSHFSEEEYEELCSNFVQRTQIPFIHNKLLPQSIKIEIWQMTKGHVGYTALVLHSANFHAHGITDEAKFHLFLHSDLLLQLVGEARPRLNYFSLSLPQQEALKTIWERGYDLNSANPEYDFLVRNGWISFDSSHREVSLPCPLSKQIILMAMHGNVLRPMTDSFNSLTEFMHQFLSMLDSAWMKKTMTKEEKSKTVLEAMWQFEFFRIGSQILSNASQISVNVRSGVQTLR